MPKVMLVRRVSFCAAHRLHSGYLSDEENSRIFGKCNWPSGHGHNYVLECTVKGEVDASTGVVMDLSELKEILQKAVLNRIDHRNLNTDLPEFSVTNPTSENIAVQIWKWVEKEVPKGLLYEVKLQETENNTAIYRGE